MYQFVRSLESPCTNSSARSNRHGIFQFVRSLESPWHFPITQARSKGTVPVTRLCKKSRLDKQQGPRSDDHRSIALELAILGSSIRLCMTGVIGSISPARTAAAAAAILARFFPQAADQPLTHWYGASHHGLPVPNVGNRCSCTVSKLLHTAHVRLRSTTGSINL